MVLTPKNVNDLSCEWLAYALEAPVSGYTVTEAHAGTTGRAVLDLEYGKPTDLPSRLFVKLPPADELQQAFVTSSGMGRREARFYTTLSAEIPVRVPHCYFAVSDDVGEDYIMLLEHLEDSRCTFRNAKTRYGENYVREVLAAFARFHAAYWTSPRFDSDLAWVQPPVQHEIALPLMEKALKIHAASMPSVFRDMGELYLNRTDDIHRLWNRGAPTLIHGDVHDGNLFFDADGPGFLDWALVAKAPAMRDISYFLAGVLTSADQQAWGPDMLDYYRKQLLALGAPAPSAQELWQQYQWHAAYVWVGSAVTLAMGDAWQPVNYMLASLERLHAAMETLGSVEAIRAAI
jgi:thiamine kinase-like enzyme